VVSLRSNRARAEADWLSAAGAHELARRIEAYWSEHGAKVKCRIEPCGSWKNTAMYAVRSNLQSNGTPAPQH
jgi:hypothetical protein